MSVVSTLRADYIKSASGKMLMLSHAVLHDISVTLKEPQQALIAALENTVTIAHEFNAYRVELARSLMQL